VHLSAIVAAIYVLALRIAPTTDTDWLPSVRTSGQRAFATAASAAALVTGFTALATLGTSAALRLDPSLQFLQLLSALDIAWVVAATVIGTRWAFGMNIARAAGGAMSIVCVWSIWRYLNEVGFTEGGAGGWWTVKRFRGWSSPLIRSRRW